MNRRALITHGTRAAAGLAAALVGVKVVEARPPHTLAEESDRVIVLRVESLDSHIVKVIQEDIKNNGPLRDLIAPDF